MKRALSMLFLPLAACAVPHMVGENDTDESAISCAMTTCNGTAVCVDMACVQPTSSLCGGFGGLQCPNGQQCVDNPRDGCRWGQDPDCGGVCVPSTTTDAGNTTPADGGTNPVHCGGLPPPGGDPGCPQGQRCVDDPTDGCTHGVDPDCGGICAPDPDAVIRCGGHVINPVFCPAGYVCVDDPNGPSMAVDAMGLCIKKLACAGLHGGACPTGLDCVDDPADSCDPNTGGADCIGYCVLHPGGNFFCGGFGNFSCANASLRCLEDPRDDCDPNNGGADCGGICVP